MKKDLRDRIKDNEFEPAMEYPASPVKPRLNLKHTSQEVELYAGLLKDFESKLLDYKELKKRYNQVERKLYDIFKEECLKDCGIADHPNAGKAWSMAWQRGKSEGNMAVLYELEELSTLMVESLFTDIRSAIADDDPTEIRSPEPFVQSEWQPVGKTKKGK